MFNLIHYQNETFHQNIAHCSVSVGCCRECDVVNVIMQT